MQYRTLFLTLKKWFSQQPDTSRLQEPGLVVQNYTFTSDHASVLPGEEAYRCDRHDRVFEDISRSGTPKHVEHYPESLNRADCTIQSNRRFRYSLFRRPEDKRVENVILLFHGLNERYWTKYLPWACKLVELTGHAVLLFPIAFHMNRAPAEWADPRVMKQVSDERKQTFPAIAHSTFVNAAISMRVQTMPQRFFYSGLQTYRDVIQLISQIRANRHASITCNANIDLFAYSIGSFLSEILMLTNPQGLLSESRLFMFCGGPTLDRMYPVSRYILDSEANIALYSFFIEHLDNEFKRDERLNHYFNEDHRSGRYFRAMLSYPRGRQFREKRFAELSNRIMAVGLKQDEVVPPVEIMNTLKGAYRDIPIPVEMLEFPFEYSHVTPFPARKSDAEIIDNEFNELFKKAAAFLTGKSD